MRVRAQVPGTGYIEPGCACCVKTRSCPFISGGSGSKYLTWRASPKVAGVTGGLHKTEVILGALHGGYLDALVTKELVALRLLQLGREF
jgi:hypothetical protein